MIQFVKVARVEDIPPGGRIWHEFEEDTVVIFNVNGEIYCLADICTHDGGPLGEGEIEGYAVECPRHGARFDIRDGKVLRLPATEDVRCYQVKVENGDILVESPDVW